MNRKEHWENIYKKDSALDVSWYQKKPSVSLQLITRYSPAHSKLIIDVGGGASTLPDHLLVEGYSNITILDLSSNAFLQSKQRLGNKASLIDWIVCDVTEFKAKHKYDLWHDRAVFHFLTDNDDRKKYQRVLNASVKLGGHIIIAAFSLEGPTQCSGLDIVQYDEKKLGKELGVNFTLIEQLKETHNTPSGKEQVFGYYLFKKVS